MAETASYERKILIERQTTSSNKEIWTAFFPDQKEEEGIKNPFSYHQLHLLITLGRGRIQSILPHKESEIIFPDQNCRPSLENMPHLVGLNPTAQNYPLEAKEKLPPQESCVHLNELMYYLYLLLTTKKEQNKDPKFLHFYSVADAKGELAGEASLKFNHAFEPDHDLDDETLTINASPSKPPEFVYFKDGDVKEFLNQKLKKAWRETTGLENRLRLFKKMIKNKIPPLVHELITFALQSAWAAFPTPERARNNPEDYEKELQKRFEDQCYRFRKN